MGLFDSLYKGLFGSATEDAAKEAAARNAALSMDAFNRGNQYIQGYQGNALGAIGTGLTDATGAIDTGVNQAVTQGFQPAIAAGQAGVQAFAPLSQLGEKYGGATSTYLDALGVNGPERQKAAFSMYTQSPGTQFAIDAATKAAANRAASLGVAGGGNTLDAIGEIARGRTEGDISSNFLDRLASFTNPELAAVSGAATGTAGANKTLADIYGGLGGLYSGAGTAKAGLITGAAGDTANIYGNVLAGQTQGSQNLAAGATAANNLAYQGTAAQQASSNNFWNNLIGAAGSAFGGGKKVA